MAIADAHDAMINDRPYKRAMDHEAALVELRRHSVTRFDPDLVNLFLRRFADLAPVPDLTPCDHGRGRRHPGHREPAPGNGLIHGPLRRVDGRDPPHWTL